MVNERADKRLGWSLKSRAKIQNLALIILGLLRSKKLSSCKDKKIHFAAALLAGCAFSLWRAVFLTHHAPQSTKKNLALAAKYLDKVVRHNIINYSDDFKCRGWICGYYAYNVRYRLIHLSEEYLPELKEKLREVGLWDDAKKIRLPLGFKDRSIDLDQYHNALEIAVQCLASRLKWKGIAL